MKASNGRRTLQSALAVAEEPAIIVPNKVLGKVPSEFERVFRAHHGLVFRTAYRITGNAADAEDVAQTVFLRLLRRGTGADALKNEALENEEAYLRRAAINAALDVIRSRQSDRTVELPDLPEPASDDPRELQMALGQALGRALAELKPRPAEIFTLRFLEGFSNPQIARMLGMSQVLVAVIVHRTRQQLRKALGAYRFSSVQETGHEK